MTIEQSTARPGRRSRRGRANQTRTQRASDYGNLTSNLPLASAYSEDQIATIHASALKILQEVGVRVLHHEARTYLAEGGATVEDLQVHFPKELVENAIASAPSRFTITSAGGTLDIGGRTRSSCRLAVRRMPWIWAVASAPGPSKIFATSSGSRRASTCCT